MSGLREVNRERFYQLLSAERRDVHPSITTRTYPYTSDWEFHKLPGKPLFGRTEGRLEGGLTKTLYFVSASSEATP